jgi:hypothetical protein
MCQQIQLLIPKRPSTKIKKHMVYKTFNLDPNRALGNTENLRHSPTPPHKI